MLSLTQDIALVPSSSIIHIRTDHCCTNSVKMTAFKLTEMNCDLFDVPQHYSLAYTSTADFFPEKGTLAWKFSIIFGQTDQLRRQHIQCGNIAVLEENARFIYHLVIVENTYQRTTYENLQAALICMRHHMRNYGASKVAMPRICCGSEGLKWPRFSTPRCRIMERSVHDKKSTENCSVVHSISADFAMCRNIGLQFKCKNGQNHEMLRQDHHTGSVAVLKDHKRYVYNLVTKERQHEKSTYIALFYALLTTRDHMRQHGVRKLAIPRLGCGIDRLEWFRVKSILEMVFADDDIEITTYSHEPLISVASREQLHVHCVT
uniref:Macro domain-containing protein n=1 Tax=Glossina pallidipes TaxID=7398 RepID=A0A1A9ZSH4_GLOPL